MLYLSMKYFTTKKRHPIGRTKGRIVEKINTRVNIPIENDC